MAATQCGWCGKESVMRPVEVDVEHRWVHRSDTAVVTATYRCDYCRLLSVAALFLSNRPHIGDDIPRANPEDVDRTIIEKKAKVVWHPQWKNRGAQFPDVPKPIAAVATEASACHASGHYRAAVILARAVIEATAKAHKVSGRLFDKIEALGKERVLSPSTVEAAHAIRDSGNAVAHGDFVEYVIEVSEDESAEVMMLMSLVLREGFQIAEEARRVRAAAAARKAVK